ncbi:MAG TPA: N-6 DNA methylase [Gemmatimonadaceae bacterium]|nr:N-6 DNA methylase [Gemmatimonadaceae bacterium]
MRSLSSATRLLAGCTTVAGTAPLVKELGFSSNLVPLDIEAIDRLNLPSDLENLHIASGHDSLRALVFEILSGADLRVTLLRVAARLASRAPQLHFLLIALATGDRSATVAAFSSEGSRQKVHSLTSRLDDIVDSDAETLCLLAAAPHPAPLTHCHWLETLGRESVSKKFFRTLERVVGNLSRALQPAPCDADASELALLYVSRLLFLSFLETKGWLNTEHSFLESHYSKCMLAGGQYHNHVLKPLFFGTLNTRVRNRSKRAREFGRVPFLNGGLFTRTPLEMRTTRCSFTDDALGDVFGEMLTRYRFTAREDGHSWTEAAIDPEMLGKAFESLMSSRERKTSGAFYTPNSLVREVSRSALVYGLAGGSLTSEAVACAMDGAVPHPDRRAAILERIDKAKVLDPACGSGAFLVHTLEELASLRVKLGDLRPVHSIRRQLVTESIFGVDVNPTAVWLCELRLWLSMAIEDPEIDPLRVLTLPNLDRNIRVGDSLSGEPFGGLKVIRSGELIARTRSRYARASGPRKKAFARELDRIERKCAIAFERQRILSLTYERRDMLSMIRSRDLFGQRRYNASNFGSRLSSIKSELAQHRAALQRLQNGGALPFSFPTGFADAANSGGFSIIVGNPPWIRTHNLPASERARMRGQFAVFRNSAWQRGATAAGAGRGFGSQVDSAALFVERCIELLRPGGAMSLVLPAKLFKSLAGGGMRQHVIERAAICEIHDLTHRSDVFDAAVYPSILTLSLDGEANRIKVASHTPREVISWPATVKTLRLDDSAGSPWILAPPKVRSAFDVLRACGTPLAESSVGRPLLGVKTGCNDAFVVESAADIEPEILRPVIRGDQVNAWSIERNDSRIIWTHDAHGPLKSLPPKAEKWLREWRRDLEKRTDAARAKRWWSLFRVECMTDSAARVIWPDIGRRPRAVVLSGDDCSVPLNSCYVARCIDTNDAFTLAAILNSTIAAAWLSLIAEPARGGYMRFMGWTVSLLPSPGNWEHARKLLAPLGRRASDGDLPSDGDLLARVLDAYKLKSSEIEPLLTWAGFEI